MVSNGTPRLCEPTDGTPLMVGHEQTLTGIDFVLERQSTIRGVVTADGELPFETMLDLFRPDGTRHSRDFADVGTGEYELPRIDPGTYYLMARAAGYADQIWNGGACHVTWGTPLLTCDPSAQGTPIVVGPDQEVAGIDVRMEAPGFDHRPGHQRDQRGAGDRRLGRGLHRRGSAHLHRRLGSR